MKIQNEVFPGFRLSKVRTFLFWLGAPVKGAFFIMAVYGLMSKNPSARTALFVAMSSIPPLNVAFPFRYQGFVLGPTMVGGVLSVILWLSFFLTKEPYRQSEQDLKENVGRLQATRWGVFEYALFGITSFVITVLAFLFLFFPKTALAFSFPCLSGSFNSSQQEFPGMIYHSMASGTHLLGLAIGSWVATINCRRNSSLRQAITIANTVFVALFFFFPIKHMVVELGMKCIPVSFLYVLAFLLIAWLFYTAFSIQRKHSPTSVTN